MNPWEKYGAPAAPGPWARYAEAPKVAAPAATIPEAAANPRVDTPLGTIQGETSTGFNPAAALIGAGHAFDKLTEGKRQVNLMAQYAVKRLFGGGQEELDQLDAQKQAMAEKEKLFKPLQEVNPGSTLIGEIAPAAMTPMRALPLIAATEYGGAGERAGRAALAYAGNKLTEKAGAALASAGERQAARQAQNAVRDTNVKLAQDAGYVALPSEAGGGVVARTIEGAAGKKTAQAASVKNQDVTNMLVRREFGLADDAPLTVETMRAVRAQAADAGYAPIRNLGEGRIRIKPDDAFREEIASITSRADNAAQGFGDAVKSDVAGFVESLSKTKNFSGSEAVDAAAIFREKASEAYAKGDKTVGAAYRKAADAIEGQLERFLTRSGKDGIGMLKNFRDARTTMAKSFEVEKALREGQGVVNAHVLKRIYEKNPKRLSGNLETIGRAASSMPSVTRVPQQGWNTSVTALDSMGTGLASIALDSAAPFMLPAARIGARSGLLSPMGQKFAVPDYAVGNVTKGLGGLLNNPYVPGPYAGGLGGLLAYEAATR